MFKFVKGIFSSSMPAPSSSIDKDEAEAEEELAVEREELVPDVQHDTESHENDRVEPQAILPGARANTTAMEPPSMTNGTPRVGNGFTTPSAVKGSSGKKKNKGKKSTDARHIKNEKKKERKRKKRDALDSSVMDSSVMDSSVMGDEVGARGMEGEDYNMEADESFVSPDLSRTLGNLFDTLPTKAVVEEPKPKKSKKAKKASKKELEDQAVTTNTNGIASQLAQDPEPVVEETQDMQTLLRQAQLAEVGERQAKEINTPVLAAESKSSGSRRQSQSDGTGLVEKIKKAKQKARQSPRKPSQESVAALQDEDEDNSAALHKPLTPAPFNPPKPQSPSQPTVEDIAEAEAQIQSNAWSTGDIDANPEEDDEEEPIQPSKKALGKRKASTTLAKPSAKRRKSKDNEETPATLRTFGFVSSSAPSQATKQLRNASRSASHDGSVIAEEAANMFGTQMDLERTSPLPETQASSSLDVASSQQRRRPTPAFTPVNPRKRLAGVVIPAPARDPFELPPSSQPHPESEPELPERQPSPPSHLSSESDSELPPKPPTSTERRKRRLPTGEPEASQIKPKVTKRLRSKSEIVNESAKSSTPTPGASKPKTPKSRTSKIPTSSQASPASKGARLSPEDITAIGEAVEAYREQNDMEQVTLNAVIQGDAKEHARKFWAHMYEEIPHLPKPKIQNHCRRNFHNFEARGTWTEEADQDLRDAHERNGDKWVQIGKELNRFSEDCRDRWRNYLSCGDKLKKEAWDREEEEKLRDIVEELLKIILTGEGRKPEDIKKDDYFKLDWKKVSSLMGLTRSRLQCQTKWKLILDREDSETKDPVASQPISKAAWRLEQAEKEARNMKPSEKLLLLYHIRDSKAGKEGKIPWPSIQQDLNVRGRKMGFRVCYRNMKLHVPDSKGMKLQDVVSALIDLYEAAAPREPKGFDTFMLSALDRRTSRSASRGNSKEEDEDSEDDDDESHDGEPQTITKKSRTSSAKKDNGEGPSTQPSRLRLAKGRKSAMLSEMDHENNDTPVKTRSPKKLRSRMKVVDQKVSQETATDGGVAESADDIGAAFEKVKSSQAKSPRVAKKPIGKARISRGGATGKKGKRLSEKYVFENEEEEEEVAVEASTPKPLPASRAGSSDDDVGGNLQPDEEIQRGIEDNQPDDEMNQDSDEDEQSDLDDEVLPPPYDHEIAESDIQMDDAPPINGFVDSEAENEDEDQNSNIDEDEDKDAKVPSTNHGTASVDLDEASHITSRENDISEEGDEIFNGDQDSDGDSFDFTRVRREESADADGDLNGDADVEGNGDSSSEDGDEGATGYESQAQDEAKRKSISSPMNGFGRANGKINEHEKVRAYLDEPEYKDEKSESESDGGESDVGIGPKYSGPKPGRFQREKSVHEDRDDDSSDVSSIPHTPKVKKNVPVPEKVMGMGMGRGMGIGRVTRTSREREGSVEL
ncbi:hypothetical protein VTL71DRAFT_4471 [Oculimacula yallundae]|uniref:Uncharacterized protein n=1 Tax=Oculimacula yallundae TaxID=86028 RepID=A0ABR4C374_9HELO